VTLPAPCPWRNRSASRLGATASNVRAITFARHAGHSSGGVASQTANVLLLLALAAANRSDRSG